MPDIEKLHPEIPSFQPEKPGTTLRDIGRENLSREPVPREIKTWMQKVEDLSPPAVTDDQGRTLLDPNPSKPSKIILPLSKENFISGFKKSFEDAGRWLSVFVLRLIKKKSAQVTFKQP